jgi:hypothetical protein
MFFRHKTIPLFFLAVAHSSSGFGDDTASRSVEWKNNWNSATSRALGGSQTAHAFNEDALYSNPAALSKTRHPRSRKMFDVIDAPALSLGGNNAAVSSFKGNGLKPAEWLKGLVQASPQQRSYFELQTLPWTVIGNRGGPSYFIGLPLRSTLTGNASTDGGISRTISSETTATAALNINFSTRTGAAAFGLSLRPNVRWNSFLSMNLADSGSSKTVFKSVKSGIHRTTAAPIDLGFLVTAGDFWLPSFGVSILNFPTGCIDNYLNPATGKRQSVCGSLRSGDVQDDIDSTRIDPAEIRLGTSIVPRVRLGSVRLNLKISGDIYPLPITSGGKNYGYTDVNINQLTHAGVELFLGNTYNFRSFSVRAGLNHTRVSWGLTLPIANLSLDLSSYEAALFTNGKATKEKRYLLGLSSHW